MEDNPNESQDSDGDKKVKLEKALSLNRQMQQQLLLVREKLEKLLSSVKDNYKANEVLLKEGLNSRRKKGVGIKGAYLKGGTFYLKGNMFFKDSECRNCPNNPDYEKRKKENEMFPMDLELQGRHIWSTKDKQGVVLGIKEQVIDHLKRHSKELNIPKNFEFDSEKLVKLLNMVPKDFRIDWEHISSYNVQHRHSANSCEAIWYVFLHPVIRRSAWSDTENQKLLEASQKYNFQNWPAIAKEVGQRSEFQCFVQYQNYVCYMLPEYRGAKWTKEDDKRLIEVVGKNTIHGVVNWSNVMSHFPQKPKTTLQSRYTYSLNPRISHEKFTPEEDLLLLAAVKEYGTKFNYFPRTLFPNRTVVQLRSRYKNTLLHRHNYSPWTLEEDIKLMEFVTINGTKSWLECSKFLLDKHTRTSCRGRFLTIKKFLEKDPDASIESIPRKNVRPKGCITTENWNEKLQELKDNPNADLNKHPRKQKQRKTVENPNTELEETGKSNTKNRKRNTKTRKNTGSIEFLKESKILQNDLTEPNQTIKLPVKKHPYKPKISRNTKNKTPKKTEFVNLKEPVQTPKKSPSKKIKPYISILKTNGLKNYNYFKYAYNFEIDQDPCDKIQPDKESLTVVRSALNPKISKAFKNYKFDASIPEHVRPNIIDTLEKSSNYKVPQVLPPNWSSAMGFRSLCIHAASNDLEHVPSPVLDDSNEHIKLFRERLRSLFYSTALLSRLHPNMIGSITTVELQDNDNLQDNNETQDNDESQDNGDIEEDSINSTFTETNSTAKLKRPRYSSEQEDDNKPTNKKKCMEIIENIKTEMES